MAAFLRESAGSVDQSGLGDQARAKGQGDGGSRCRLPAQPVQHEPHRQRLDHHVVRQLVVPALHFPAQVSRRKNARLEDLLSRFQNPSLVEGNLRRRGRLPEVTSLLIASAIDKQPKAVPTVSHAARLRLPRLNACEAIIRPETTPRKKSEK